MTAACVLLLAAPVWLSAAPRAIDTEKSSMTIRVYKTGLFSAFGHDHEIQAPITEGNFSEENPAVELKVDARLLRVLDKDVSNEDRAKVQETMLGPQVLDSQKFPGISFKSTRVDRLGDGRWIVHGTLTLHGIARAVDVQVEGQSGHYRGWAKLKQKDFGMTPVSVAGGTVKVKDEVRIEFDVVAK